MNELVNKVIESIQCLLPEVEVSTQQISKNNDVVKTGVILKSKDNNLAPVFYIDDLIVEDWSAEDIASYIYKSYLENEIKDYKNLINIISDFEKISDLLTVQIVNRTLNQSALIDVPFVPFLGDLASVVLVDLEKGNCVSATIKVTKQLLEIWGMTFEKVYSVAYANLIKEKPVMFSMEELLSVLGYQEAKELDSNMYVLTNESRIHGATMMLRESLFKELTERFRSDLIVIPSSLHEVLLVPIENSFDAYKEQFDEIVREVNRTQLDPVEILADHIYLYRRNGGWCDFN